MKQLKALLKPIHFILPFIGRIFNHRAPQESGEQTDLGYLLISNMPLNISCEFHVHEYLNSDPFNWQGQNE